MNMFSRFFGGGESKEAREQAELASAVESIQKKLEGTIAGEGVSEERFKRDDMDTPEFTQDVLRRFKQDAMATPELIQDVLKGLQDSGLDITSSGVQASAAEQINKMALEGDTSTRSYDAAPGDTRGGRTYETSIQDTFAAGKSREFDAKNQENTGEEAKRREANDEARDKAAQRSMDTASLRRAVEDQAAADKIKKDIAA